MPADRSLLILGPSYRRRKSNGSLPAIERYDGLFFRVARKYLKGARKVDSAVMVDDLSLVDDITPLPNIEPQGPHWGAKKISDDIVEKAKAKNRDFLDKKLRRKRYSEVFISMGKDYAQALPVLDEYPVKVVFPASGGPGPKARALSEWLQTKK